jgi:integrase
LTFSRNGVSITIWHSKTDAAGKGRVVALPSGASDLCPVRALRDWLARLSSLCPAADDGALFRRIDRYGQLGGPLGAAATGPILQKRLALSGRPSAGFSAHSLRAGLVTSAALAGVPVWSIQRQTGHRSETMVHRYIRDLTPFQANAFGAIARTTK